MSVNGFLVSIASLNIFWCDAFHYINYQGSGCSCAHGSDQPDQCKIDGRAVLEYHNHATNRLETYIGIIIGIIAVCRLLGYLALHFRKQCWRIQREMKK